MLVTVDKAVEMLLHGEVVAVPTETVYGLAAIATNPTAIARIFEVKNRPADNPLICHFHSAEQVSEYVTHLPANTSRLMSHFSPGPVSFMLDLPEDSPLRFATCGSMQVIARIPDHPLFLAIIEKCQAPVAAPSANRSGRVSPTSAAMVMEDLGTRISGIVDGGPSKIGLESTIVDARAMDTVTILRPGSIAEKEIQEILPGVSIVSGNEHSGIITPGTKYRHYAPATPLFVLHRAEEALAFPQSALILTAEALQHIPRQTLTQFTEKGIHLVTLGSLAEPESIARNFYRLISSVDHLKVKKAFMLNTDFGRSSTGKALQNRISKIASDHHISDLSDDAAP